MAFKKPYNKPFLAFYLRTRPAEQVLFITRIYNKLIDGRTFLLSPTAIAASYDEPRTFIEFYQLYYDPLLQIFLRSVKIALIRNFPHYTSMMR